MRGIVSGRVAQHKDTLIVKAELVDVVKQDQLWGDHYNRKMADLLDVQDEIAREIASRLQQRLMVETRKRPASRPTQNLEAYRIYLQAQQQSYRWSQEGLRKSIELFQQAISVDPTHAPSYAGLSYALAMTGFFGYLPGVEVYTRAEAAAKRALELDDSLGEPHAAMGWVALQYHFNGKEALAHYRKAIELRPDLAIAYHGLGVCHVTQRNYVEAIPAMRKAADLDPLTPLFLAHLGWALHCSGNDEEAIRVMNSVLELYPGDYYTLRVRLYACITGKRPDLAVQSRPLVGMHIKSRQIALGLEAWACAAAGQFDEARKIRDKLVAEPAVEVGVEYYVAMVCCVLGENQQAMDWLEKAYEHRLGIISILAGEPTWAPLRSEPHFQTLLRKLDLPV